jgi:hypothetical protein
MRCWIALAVHSVVGKHVVSLECRKREGRRTVAHPVGELVVLELDFASGEDSGEELGEEVIRKGCIIGKSIGLTLASAASFQCIGIVAVFGSGSV